MNKEKQYGKDLGILFGSLDAGISPSGVNVEDGFSSAYEEDFRNKRHSHIMKAAHIIVSEHLGEGTPSLRHLSALCSVNRHHSSHVKEASDIVFDTIRNFNPLYKEAGFKDLVIPMIGTAGTGALWAGAGAAAGIGALGGGLYHLTKKEVEEENDENEVKKRKIEYYKNLARELDRNMSKRYEYAQ